MSWRTHPRRSEPERLIDRIRGSVIGDDAVIEGPFGPRRIGLRRRHGIGPLTDVRRGLHPRSGAADVRQHAHRGVGDRATNHRAARGGAPRHRPGGERGRAGRRHLLRHRRDRRHRQADPRSAAGRSRAAGGVHRALRAPLERAAVAGVGRRRRDDPRGPARPRRPRPPRARAAPPRGPGAEDRQLLGRVERDRDRHGRRRGGDRSAPARSAVVLGLRGRRPVPPDRHEPGAGRRGRPPGLQGRGVHLAPQVRRRPRDARGAGGQALAAAQPRSVGAGRRDDPVRQPDRSVLPPRSGDPRGGRNPGDRRVDPRRAGVRAQGRGRQSRRSAAASTTSRVARWRPGREPADRDPRRHRPGAPRDRVDRRAPRGGLLHANFVVAVLSDLFGIQARSGCFCAGPYIHRMYPIDERWSARMQAEVERSHGRQARLHPAQLQLLHQRAGVRLRRRRRPPARPRGLEAAAALPLRSRGRALASPRRRPAPARPVSATR